MADLLPSSPDASAAEEADPRVIGVDSDDADDLIAALSSGTARALLAALHDDPANPAKLADAVDTTIQNAQYHLEKLVDAGLIEIVDTVYSEKGREMQVYAPSDRPLVVVAGREEETSDLQAALSRLLGAFAALAVGSAVVQKLLAGGLFSPGGPGSSGPVSYDDGAKSDGGGAADSTAAQNESGTLSPTSETDLGASSTGDQAATSTASGASEGSQTPTSTPTQTPESAQTTTPTPEATRTPFDAAEATATHASDFVAQAGPDVAPGLLFFAGGAAVLIAGIAWWYVQR